MAHYYEATQSGVEPRHFVPIKNRPDLRPTRITDVRKWWKEGREVFPSVTTVLNVLDKPGLNNWKVDQHLNMAITVNQDQHLADYIAEVKRLTELEMDKAPSAGTNLHDSMEKYVLGELEIQHQDYFLCEKVAETVAEVTGDFMGNWKTEVSFAQHGYGGQIDLVIGEQNAFSETAPWLIDYKTKQTSDKFKPGKMAYDEHAMQLAAYRNGLDIPSARCANVFVCLEDGQVDFHEHEEEALKRGWRMFEHALALWQLQNNAEAA